MPSLVTAAPLTVLRGAFRTRGVQRLRPVGGVTGFVLRGTILLAGLVRFAESPPNPSAFVAESLARLLLGHVHGRFDGSDRGCLTIHRAGWGRGR